MKTTTLAVLSANAIAVIRRRKNTQLFNRRIDEHTLNSAAACLVMYLFFPFVCAFIISAVEKLPFGICLFETSSAIGTVGLSLGITTSVGRLSHLILIGLMFLGRVGGLTVMYAAVNSSEAEVAHRPIGRINVG